MGLKALYRYFNIYSSKNFGFLFIRYRFFMVLKCYLHFKRYKDTQSSGMDSSMFEYVHTVLSS